MKIVAVGDIHGRGAWESIVNKQGFDKVVFTGDYFDSFNIPAQEQIRNFQKIVAYKKANAEKVVLLIGNHDFHYMPVARSIGETYSGFQDCCALQIGLLLQQHGDLLQMCYRWGDYLFTHAGVTQTWLDGAGYNGGETEDFINDLFRYNPRNFFFNGNDPYGDDVTQSPLWVRPRSLRKDAFRSETLRQVVGHTAMRILDLSEDHFFFIDTLGTSRQYLVIEDGSVRAERVP